jgi:hypothetical protein
MSTLTMFLASALLAAIAGCSESSPPAAGSGGEGMAPGAGTGGDTNGGGAGAGTGGVDSGGTSGSAGASLSGAAGSEPAGAPSAGAAGSSGSAGAPPMGGAAGSAGTETAGAGSAGAGAAPGLDCVVTGAVSYSLARSETPIAAETAAYALITRAMDLAVGYYNCHTDLSLSLDVHFDATFAIVETTGTSIYFGAMDAMNPVTAMHQIARIAGVGSPEFAELVQDGIFTGEAATAELRAITSDDSAVLHADTEHFWPYGLNYPNEVKATSDLVNHCKLVMAIREDVGL